jgi:protein AATF/BFR2
LASVEDEEEEKDPFAARDMIESDSELSGASKSSEDSDENLEENNELKEANGRSKVSKRRDGDVIQEKADQSDSASEEGEEYNESLSESQSDSDVAMDDLDDDDDDDDQEASEASSASAEPARPRQSEAITVREQLKALQKNEISQVAAGLSLTDDIKQGRAVKQQRSTYDRLLDARIKLQKGLTASNDLPRDTITDVSAKEAFQKAEAAALSLWSTIDSLRCAVFSATANSDSQKRKRALNPTSAISSTELWTHSQSLESLSLPHLREVLNHWSARTRASAPSQHPRSNASAEPPLTSIIDEYLSKETSKLITTSTAEPTNPPDTTDPSPISNLTFSDSAFYQSLLRDLIASRTDNPLITSTDTLTSTSQAKPTPLNNQRNRRGVDTKASKGRKIRYTPHEKLVNFMAPEDRSTWGDQARREFFGSLFGARRVGGGDGSGREGIGIDGSEEMDLGAAIGGEEGALRLFRS